MCLQVVGGHRSKDVKKKGTKGRKTKEDRRGDGQTDKPLHWVNMQILDHRYECHMIIT